RGSPDGGTIVTIAGDHFRDSTVVRFGKMAALHNRESNGILIAVTPPHDQGVVDIEVANGKKVARLRNAFTYSWEAPVLFSVEPETGSERGGFRIVLKGRHFRPDTIVRWNGEEVRVRHLDSETIALTAPPGSGSVTIEVGALENRSTLKDAFRYRLAPQITSITPSMGTTEGGYTVTIKGRNFESDCSVLFDDQYAPTVFLNPNALAAVAPGGESSRISISVTNSDGAKDTLDRSFLYNDPPEIETITAEPEPIVRNTTSMITVRASDPEAGPLRYEYRVAQGPDGSSVAGHGERATFRSPNTVGTAIVQVVVYDEHGAKTQGNVQIKVE
ncbi:MAG TPA: IPT/TIG domain-containing protein, partial [Acidobacteriota bacterium]|nr:IPT/TIG domain-containing protein [Acidobacteriota bacterium]